MAARITGILGAVYLGATPTKVADVYDWVFTPTTDLHPVDIKGDRFHKFVPGAGGATFTAKRRHQAASVFNILAQDAAANGTQLLFRLDLIDNSGSYGQIQGQGYVSAGSLNAPQGPVDDTIEVTFDGVWTQT